MRNIITTLFLLSICICSQAQSLLDLFNSSSSTTTATVEPTPLSNSSIAGEWSYTKLSVDLAEGSALKGFAGTAVIGQVESLLNGTASSSGITANMFTVTFDGNNTATFIFKDNESKTEIPYSINVDQASISFDMGSIKDIEIGSMTAQTTITDGKAALLFIANDLIAVADKLPDMADNTQYQMIKGIAANVDGLLLGITITKL
ncbi:MAG: DUF4923 family protein [Rikenellaceae bacterium]